jgi:transcriptional regulator with XRE-family HTH domain
VDGKWLREHRLEKGWSQMQLAQIAGLPHSPESGAAPLISGYELGTNTMPLEHKTALERALRSEQEPSPGMLRRLTKPSPNGAERKHKGGRNILPIDVKREALKRIDGGESSRKIAKELGIGQSTISGWRRQLGGPTTNWVKTQSTIHVSTSTMLTELRKKREALEVAITALEDLS